MRASGAALLIVVGLLALWVTLTGRLGRVLEAWDIVTSPEKPAGSAMPSAGGGARQAWLPFPGADDFIARTTGGRVS